VRYPGCPHALLGRLLPLPCRPLLPRSCQEVVHAVLGPPGAPRCWALAADPGGRRSLCRQRRRGQMSGSPPHRQLGWTPPQLYAAHPRLIRSLSTGR